MANGTDQTGAKQYQDPSYKVQFQIACRVLFDVREREREINHTYHERKN